MSKTKLTTKQPIDAPDPLFSLLSCLSLFLSLPLLIPLSYKHSLSSSRLSMASTTQAQAYPPRSTYHPGTGKIPDRTAINHNNPPPFGASSMLRSRADNGAGAMGMGAGGGIGSGLMYGPGSSSVQPPPPQQQQQQVGQGGGRQQQLHQQQNKHGMDGNDPGNATTGGNPFHELSEEQREEINEAVCNALTCFSLSQSNMCL